MSPRLICVDWGNFCLLSYDCTWTLSFPGFSISMGFVICRISKRKTIFPSRPAESCIGRVWDVRSLSIQSTFLCHVLPETPQVLPGASSTGFVATICEGVASISQLGRERSGGDDLRRSGGDEFGSGWSSGEASPWGSSVARRLLAPPKGKLPAPLCFPLSLFAPAMALWWWGSPWGVIGVPGRRFCSV